MSVDPPVGSRTQFLVRLQRSMDMALDDWDRASRSKDGDEKEARAIRSMVLKLARIWDKATANSLSNARSTGRIEPPLRKTSEAETRED